MEEQRSGTAVAVRVNPQAIQQMKGEIRLLQGMVKDLLIRGVDYGRIPGTPADSLWEPGASQIIGSFNCYVGERRILKFEDTSDRISICVEVPIMSRETGRMAATGIGAASTLETKYKYRWVEKPADWGYDEESTKGLKTKVDRDRTLYRIPNPEHGELLNTIIKMASKRAEVDGAESLPGVASVLRQMLSGRSPGNRNQDESPEYEGPVWTRFWGEVRKLGLTDQEAHLRLGVTSMKRWLASGHSLDEALDIFRGRQEQPEEESSEPTELPKNPIFHSWGEIAEAAHKLGVSQEEVFKRSGIKGWPGFASYLDAWRVVEELVNERAQKPTMT